MLRRRLAADAGILHLARGGVCTHEWSPVLAPVYERQGISRLTGRRYIRPLVWREPSDQRGLYLIGLPPQAGWRFCARRQVIRSLRYQVDGPLGAPESITIYPTPLAAFTQPQPKTSDVIIPENHVPLSGRQRELSRTSDCQFHGIPPPRLGNFRAAGKHPFASTHCQLVRGYESDLPANQGLLIGMSGIGQQSTMK